ncbi:MAG: hypothetical protein JSR45_01060 [Proteobacteria bacterium]|nr:hypothetical protein [Pseudomonadota bacterium]
MIPALAAVLAVLAQAPAHGQQRAAVEPWTWSLYDHGAKVTLAHEVPDTDRLSEVFECTRATGDIKVSIYPGGDAKSAQKFETAMTVRDPRFPTFVQTGKLTVTQGEQNAAVTVAGKDLQTLARFGKLCGA